MKRFFSFAVVATMVLAAGAVLSAPRADAGALRLFNFQPSELTNVVAGGSAHYYLTYSLTNGTDEAHKPAVRVELRTETDKTYGDHFHAATYTAASEAAGRKETYRSTSQIRRAELGGGDSVDGLAHFGRIDPNADDLEVRVYGLWNPIVRDTKGRVFSERRVLVLKYGRTGDEYNRQDDAIRLVSKSEELEGEPTLLYGGDE